MHYLHELTRDDGELESPSIWTEYRLSTSREMPEYQDCIEVWESYDELFERVGVLRPKIIDLLKRAGVEHLLFFPEREERTPILFDIEAL